LPFENPALGTYGRMDPKCPHCRRLMAQSRMDTATVEQSRALIHDLARALREVRPDHPLLSSVFLTHARPGVR
jgi:hypothetical protein